MQNHRYRTIIIDDEPDARGVLRKLIAQFCPHLELCAEAGTVQEALVAIQVHQPELLFLDIDLGAGSGFDILKVFPRPAFKVVFVTAYDDYAVEAFRLRALHYLLKPIDPHDLVAAAGELQMPARFWPEYELLQQSLNVAATTKLLLPTLHGTIVLRPEEISHFFAEDKYAIAVLGTGEKIFVGLTLKEVVDRLPAGLFLRPHQSWIVRIDAVRKIQKGTTVSLFMMDRTLVPVSRRNKERVLRVFEGI